MFNHGIRAKLTCTIRKSLLHVICRPVPRFASFHLSDRFESIGRKGSLHDDHEVGVGRVSV